MLIKNAKIVSEDQEFIGDVRVEEGVIKEISEELKPLNSEKIIDAKGKYLLPKLVDVNVRLLDDTLNEKNLNKLLKRAKMGGVGEFVLIDDFSPRIENATQLELLKSKTKDKGVILSVNSTDKNGKLNNLATFINNKAKVIYTRSDIEGNLLIRVMQYAQMKNVPIFCFCEDESMKNRGVINEGELSFKLGLPGILKVAQISEVSKIVELATFFDVSVLFLGIYTSKSVQILRAVKKSNAKVFTEVPLHNLLLDENSSDDFNTYAKLISPLQEKEERDILIEQLKNGDIDIISSSHSPKSYIYKDVPFEDAKEGIGALDMTLRLGYTYLVKSGIVTFSHFMSMTSENPAKILGKDMRIKEGNRANMILFDPTYSEVIKDETSLYKDREIFGKIIDIAE